MGKEITLAEFEMLWGQPSYKSGLNLFAKSHASNANSVKADSGDLVITDLNEVLSDVESAISCQILFNEVLSDIDNNK